MNYAQNSPYKHLVPPISDLWNRPIYFFLAWKEVILLHEKDKSQKAVDHRNSKNDDVAKRRYFMKMHGIEPKDPVSMVFGKDDGKTAEDLEKEVMGGGEQAAQAADKAGQQEKKKRFGIF